MSSLMNVAILGSTGSVGRGALDVVADSDSLKAVGLTSHTKVELAVQQCRDCSPNWLVVTDPEAAKAVTNTSLPSNTKLLIGMDGVETMVSREEVDVVVAAIVGSAGLRGTWAALEAGKRVALANKETLVMAGKQVMELAANRKAELIPVDSEHSAIFQTLQAGDRRDVERIVLTASGGPFLRYTPEQLANVTVDEALDHPIWQMGPKITVDSATMMNKALEIIEARWLFDLAPEKIDVMIHPQSIVHSMIEFVDGSVIAQLSPPDMKLPIQYALNYPNRVEGIAERFDWSNSMELSFEPPDFDRFPALQLGFEVASRGGSTGAVVNAANEAAVDLFLNRQLAFHEIVPSCRRVLENHNFDPNPSLDQLVELDDWARKEITRKVCA